MMQDMMQMMMNMMNMQEKMSDRRLDPSDKKQMMKDMAQMKEKMQKMMSMNMGMSETRLYETTGAGDFTPKLKCAEEWLKKSYRSSRNTYKRPKNRNRTHHNMR